MKVAVTFDLSEDELIALNLIQFGRIEKPLRRDAREAITEMVNVQLEAAVPIIREQRDKINDLREASAEHTDSLLPDAPKQTTRQDAQ